MSDWADPRSVVTTDWLDAHRRDPNVCLVEVDVDEKAYEESHIPGAIGWSWTAHLCELDVRDIVGKDRFEDLMRRSGIERETTVVLYGDNHNWFAAWALWQLELYGHRDVRLLDGGREKWIAEGRALDFELPDRPRSRYVADAPDFSTRALLTEVRDAVTASSHSLVDVRSPAEYSGELLAPPGLPETCQRGGHVPGAVNVPWASTCRPDGTFRSALELRALFEKNGVSATRPTIAYCRIGERSSHTWFVLKHLLGHADVKNYDGSWTEWGNLVGAPIERGTR